MNILNRFKRKIFYAGLERDDFHRIYPEINEGNRSALMIFSLIADTFLLILTVFSFFLEPLFVNRTYYAVSTLLIGIICLLVYGPAKKNETLTVVLMYLFQAILMGFGIAVSTIGNPAEVAASYIALLLTVPLVFTDRPIRMYAVIFGSAFVFILVVFRIKEPHTWETDITNGIVFSCISAITATYFSDIKAERFNLVSTVRRMAETDQLTDLRNRTSYEQRLQSMAGLRSGSAYCVYVDVNGLHELNDTQGHDAGDRMLKFVACEMQKVFGLNNTYRIGGDEYVALGEKQEEARLQEMITGLRSTVAAAGYHIAVGLQCESSLPADIEAMVRGAEQKMYQDKAEYYRCSGKDRRRRR